MEKKNKPKNKPVPADAIVKGPNKKVPVKKLPGECSG
jgi:hypothetical protein